MTMAEMWKCVHEGAIDDAVNDIGMRVYALALAATGDEDKARAKKLGIMHAIFDVVLEDRRPNPYATED